MSIGERSSITRELARLTCWASRIAPTSKEYFWGVSYFDSDTPVRHPSDSSISDSAAEMYYAQIELRKSHTDRLNHWMIRPVTAPSNSAVPGSGVSPTVTGRYFKVCCGAVILIFAPR